MPTGEVLYPVTFVSKDGRAIGDGMDVAEKGSRPYNQWLADAEPLPEDMKEWAEKLLARHRAAKQGEG